LFESVVSKNYYAKPFVEEGMAIPMDIIQEFEIVWFV
jgi:hypothetical protein